MEVRCMQSPTLSSIPPRGFLEQTPFLRGHEGIKLPGRRLSCPVARGVKFLDLKGRASGPTKINSRAQDAAANDVRSKDGNLVFVAGATGKVGSRTVRELLKLGFRVRAGVRSIQRAESLVQSIKNMKLEDVEGGAKSIDTVELVECDLEKQDQIGPALDNSSIVICCIGASEKEIFDITGPYRIDYQATKNLIDAAASAKVDHFILVTSLGTNKVGFPAAILNLFWGVLIWKRKAEEALLASGLPYAIVRPGGMERPTDSFKETHNLTLSEEDTLFGGLVSNLQVAELMAFMAKNRSLSYCKIVEVVAETSAALTPMGELLKKIPSQREEIYPSKELDDTDVSQLVAPESSYPEKKPEQVKATAATPSSPYTVYEDLKPPSSPTPSIPTISGNDKPGSPVNEASGIMHDLKESRARPLSPYIVYEDLKPPSSPTPSVPTVSQNDKPGNPVNEKPGNVNHLKEPKARPLSPYTMYEELKPPCSPSPSPKKL